MRGVRIALVGDFDDAITAHRAIPLALRRAAAHSGVRADIEWVSTAEIHSPARVHGYEGLWCVPGSPYKSEAGALVAIHHARVMNVPFLGTCGGFQHALLEYARHVLGWHDAEHAETHPSARRTLLAPLSCSLVEVQAPVQLLAGSAIARAYGRTAITEGYHCRYGLNPEYRAELLGGALQATAWDATGEVRAVELEGHPFFVATLFQPERAALEERDAPLVVAFVAAVAAKTAR
jgi:CTP synthase (UTP-ammonia lyase)